MTINKRYLRNIKSNMSFYLCIIILTALVVCAYLSFSAAYTGERKYLDSISEELNCEDGQFMTYIPMTDEDISDIREKYGADIEKLSYYDADAVVKEKNVEIRIYKPSERIDKYKVTKGEDLKSETDILINPLFAKRQGLSVGDVIEVEGTKFTICGFALRLDYMFCLKNPTDTFSNADEFGLGIITESAFDKKTSGEAASYYVIKYGDDITDSDKSSNKNGDKNSNKNSDKNSNETEVRKELYKRFMTASYTAGDNNNRITTPKDQLEELEASVNMILPVAVIFVVILIAVVLGRKVKNEQKMIGILNALGYKKWELALHYSFFGAVPAVIGSILGVIMSVPLMDYLVDMAFENKLEPLDIHYGFRAVDAVIAFALPVLAYTLAVFVTSLRVMRGDAISMIRGISDKKKKHNMRMKKSKLGFRAKYKIRAVFGNLSRTLIVIVGMGVGGMILAFGYACIDSLEQYVNKSVAEMGAFEYEYFLNSINTGEPDYGAPAIAASFAVRDYSDAVTVMGLNDTSYLNLKDENGKDITFTDDDYYISQMASFIYGVKKGDELTFYDVCSLKEYKIKISGVFVNGSQSLIVSTNDSICGLLGITEGAYNMVMSDKKLEYADSELVKKIVKSDFAKQLKNNILKGMYESMGIIIGIGMLLLIVCVFLMVNVLLTESTVTISMLKVLGYHEREINRIVTHIYHALVPFGVVIGLVLGYYLNKINFIKSVAVYNTYIEATMSLASVVKYVLIVVVSYVLAILMLGRKVKNVDMVESLKNNRE